ncbi:MAG: CaiB/BaiF CoA-transferase family protein [Chloroflexota bacterium]
MPAPDDAFLPLHGLRVLELAEFVSGPFCGKLLADLGAAVTKVEPEGGDAARSWGPYEDDRADPDRSGLFLYLNRRKRLAPRQELPDLLASAGALIVDRSSDVPTGTGGQGQAAGRLVVTAVTPFGLTGPRAHWRGGDLVAGASSASMSLTGYRDREPLRPGGMTLLCQAGLHAALATLLQLLLGRGGLIDVSEQEAAAWPQVVAPCVVFEGRVAKRQGARVDGAHGVGLQRTADGKDLLTGFLPEKSMWESLAAFLGNPAWMADPALASPLYRSEHADEVEALATPEFARFTLRELVDGLQKLRVPVAPVNTFREIVASEQLAARGFWEDDGRYRYPGLPARVSLAHPSAPRRAALAVPRSRPLEGITVVDFGRVWAGPLVGRILAEQGARVIKIESGSRPDTSRFLRPFHGPPPDNSGFFENWNLGKQDLTLNLKHPRALEIARTLVARAQVVIQNFAPGVMDRLGLGWEDLSRDHSDLVMLSLSGLGQTGPHRHWVMFGDLVDALSGQMYVTGYPDASPTTTSSGCGDPVSGLVGVVYVLAALRQRECTGQGAHIDLSMYQAEVAMLAEPAMEWTMNRRVQPRIGNADRHFAVHGVFPCRGDDRWVAIAAHDVDAARLTALAGTSDLAAWTAQWDDTDLACALQEAGIAGRHYRRPLRRPAATVPAIHPRGGPPGHRQSALFRPALPPAVRWRSRVAGVPPPGSAQPPDSEPGHRAERWRDRRAESGRRAGLGSLGPAGGRRAKARRHRPPLRLRMWPVPVWSASRSHRPVSLSSPGGGFARVRLVSGSRSAAAHGARLSIGGDRPGTGGASH